MKLIQFCLLLLLVSPLKSQIVIKSGEGKFLIPEIAALLTEEKAKSEENSVDKTVKIERILPLPTKAELTGASISEGDVISMVNREKIVSLKQLKTIYDSLKAGDEFKMLIRRNGEAFITSFLKKKSSDASTSFMISTNSASGKNGAEPPAIIPELDAIFGNEPKGVTVVGLMQRRAPGMPEKKSGEGPIFDGDIALQLNGITIQSTIDLNEAYNKIKSGEKCVLKIKRKNKTLDIPFTKESGEGRRIILN